jgi:hypothetical protein
MLDMVMKYNTDLSSSYGKIEKVTVKQLEKAIEKYAELKAE